MNPLELQVLVLVSGVPEASAGTVLSYDWDVPASALLGGRTAARAGGARRWPGWTTELSDSPHHGMKHLRTRLRDGGHLPGAVRAARTTSRCTPIA